MIRYLLIVNSSGVPYFARSYGFSSDVNCVNFENRVKEIDLTLASGFFSALFNVGSEIVQTSLHQVDLLYEHATILAHIREDFGVIGIFEGEKVSTWEEMVVQIGDLFEKRYSHQLPLINFRQELFSPFQDDLEEAGIIIHNDEVCRNCITKCPEKKTCLPHHIYFDQQASLKNQVMTKYGPH